MEERWIALNSLYISKGLKIFPIRPNTKLPMIPKWQVDCSSNFMQLVYWNEHARDCNWGLPANENNLFIIDLDTHEEDKNGIINFNKLCEDIVRELNLDGNIGFDFMLDENDTPWLTDLNPRVTATIILYAGAGMNFPYLRVKQLLGEELPEVSLKYGTRLVRKYMDVLYNENGVVGL